MPVLGGRFAAAGLLAWSLALVLLAAVALALEPARIEPVTIETAKGRFTFSAEIADTPELRERGLMFRQRMPDDRAMLFDWGGVSPASMWMRNTYVSLDMIFIDESGKVVQIAETTEPLSERIISSSEPVAAVLEVAAGTAERIGLKSGDQVHHPMFVGN